MSSKFPLRADLTGALSRYAASVDFESLPIQCIERARDLLADYVAACYAGRRVNRQFNTALESVLANQGGRGESSVFFSSVKLPAMSAAMLNAAYSHGADMDDGNKQSMGHIGTHVISAAMALAEARQCTERAFIEAMVVGYDVFCRLAASVQPHMIKRGFHSTGTAGGMACAAACAKLIGLDTEGIYHAMALAATQSSGLLLVGETGQEAKPLNSAKAAQAGVLSALLAESGVVGPRNPLESSKGWLHSMSDEADENLVLDGLGKDYFITKCYMKLYPCCRHVHCAIQAAQELREKTDSSRICAIELHTYGNAIDLAGRIEIPRTSSEAKFSIHYALAAMLVRGHFGIADLDVSEISEEELRLIAVTKLVRDDSYEDVAHGLRGARLVISRPDGKSIETAVTVPKGDPESPFTSDDLRRKLVDCAVGALDARGVVEIEDVDAFLKRMRIFGEDASKRFAFPDITKAEGLLA